ncbi:MAG: S8 family serine peptidase, partial [Lachnospiraceae bacterium]|nr:S8 family serine peptidase [Lachnospiraceae bacterium]
MGAEGYAEVEVTDNVTASEEPSPAAITDEVSDTITVTDTPVDNSATITGGNIDQEDPSIPETEKAAEDGEEKAAENMAPANENDAVASEEVQTEAVITWQQEMAQSGISSVIPSDVDFSSMRLIVASESDAAVLDEENVLSEYDGVYLLQYDSIADVQTAYSYYVGAAAMNYIDFVDVDALIHVADITGSNLASVDEIAAGEQMAENANPLAELEAAAQSTASFSGNVVALIDTGANADANVIERVSMIGDDVADNHGHGTDMLLAMKSVNDAVQVVSVKAMDANGTGNTSAVYAAIKYAIEKNVKVINLSLSAFSTANNAAIKDAVEEAVANGIIVVGAAGNNGKNAKYFVPGSIESAVIAGAADESGVRLSSSNYGSTVDVNVVASSTSEAAAKLSAYIAADPGCVARNYDANTNGLIFATDYVPVQTEEPQTEEKETEEKTVVSESETEQVLIPDEPVDEPITDPEEGQTEQVLIPDEEIETEQIPDEETHSISIYADEMLFGLTFYNGDGHYKAGETVSIRAAFADAEYGFDSLHIVPELSENEEKALFDVTWEDEISFGTLGDVMTFTMPDYNVAIISDVFFVAAGTATVTSDGVMHAAMGWSASSSAFMYSTLKTVTYENKDYTGFCLQPLATAPNNKEIKPVAASNLITKALFYLYGGPVWGVSDYSTVQGYVKTAGSDWQAWYTASHYVMSKIYNESGYDASSHGSTIGHLNSTGVSNITKTVNALKKLPMPTTSLTGSLKVDKTEGGRQYTTKMSYTSSVDANTISFNVPKDTWVHIVAANGTETIKKYSSSKTVKATVKPGQSFCFSREASTSAPKQTITLNYKYFKEFKGYVLTLGNYQDIAFPTLTTSQKISLKWEASKPYSVRVIKTSTGKQYSFAGIQIGLYNADEGNKLIHTFTVDANSGISAYYEGLEDGVNYYVQEIATNDYYELNTQRYSFNEAGDDTNLTLDVTVPNSPRIYLQILKKSSDPKAVNGNANYSLDGAVYKLMDSN